MLKDIGQSAAAAISGTPWDRSIALMLDEVEIDNNYVDDPVVMVGGYFAAERGQIWLRDVDMHDNVAVNSVVWSVRSSLVIEGGSLTHNVAGFTPLIWANQMIGPSRISDWTVADNEVDYPAVVLHGRGQTVPVQDSTFVRNTLTAPVALGAAIHGHDITLDLSRVDFGVGADNNLPYDIGGCQVDLGVVSGQSRRGHYCP